MVCEASHCVLFWLAGLIWFIGAWACGDQAMVLMSDARDEGSSLVDPTDILIGEVVGASIGVVAAFAFFAPLCHRNIDRIEKLVRPRLYECYRLRFFICLVCLDGGTVLLTDFLAKDAVTKVIMGTIDMCICLGLGISLYVFVVRWRSFGQSLPLSQSNSFAVETDSAKESDRNPVNLTDPLLPDQRS